MTEVFVAAGVWASAAGDGGKWVDLKEIKPAQKNGYVSLIINYQSAELKPAEARKLADQLYDFARNAEERGK